MTETKQQEPAPASLKDELIRGNEALADFLGWDPRTTNNALAMGYIPGTFKTGNTWCGYRSVITEGMRRRALEEPEQRRKAVAGAKLPSEQFGELRAAQAAHARATKERRQERPRKPAPKAPPAPEPAVEPVKRKPGKPRKTAAASVAEA